MSNNGSANPFPSRTSMEFSSEVFGKIAAGAATGTYAVSISKVYQPWNSGTPFPAVITWNTATLEPAGFTSICSATAAYRTYVARASRITVSMHPGAFTDEILLSVAPIVSGTSYATTAEMSQGPYSKSTSCASQTGFVGVSDRIRVAQYWGLQEEEIASQDDYAALYNGTPVNTLDWQVNWSTFSGNVTVGVIYYRVNIYWEVDLITQAGPSLPDTVFLKSKTSLDSKSTSDEKRSDEKESKEGSQHSSSDSKANSLDRLELKKGDQERTSASTSQSTSSRVMDFQVSEQSMTGKGGTFVWVPAKE